ncbi:LysR family transcriptional regulator [Neobacillus sp. NRS-1170]|uniref:LysR family transcriptional regulator n=1 Tax=Neobacillus sp. NRS-1170 TaxID=3233898 RepID=UPI003D293462
MKYFETIVRHKNITKAAMELHISQPSLSGQIKILEQELGCKLLERSPRGVTLTKSGEILYKHSVQILHLFTNAYEEMEKVKSVGLGEISIGSIPTCTSWLFDTTLEFQKKYPHVRINIKEMEVEDIVASLKSYDIHIGVTSIATETDLLFFETIYHEELLLVTSAHHRFKDLKEIDFIDLADEPFILYPGYSMRQHILHFCEQAGFTPKVAFELDSLAMFRFIEEGLGIAIVPKSSINNELIKHQGVKFISLKNPAPFRNIYIATHQNRYLPSAIHDYKLQIAEFFKV